MKKILIIVAILTLLFGGGYLYLSISGCKQQEKIAALEENIEKLQAEYVPLRFKILSRTEDEVKVAIKFYDADGKVIGNTTKQMKGRELSIDFYVIPVKDRYLAFPVKLFTDKIAPNDGTKLMTYYNQSGFPQIFYSKKLQKELYAGLEHIFERVLNDDFTADDKYFGSMVHDIPQLRAYKTGAVYRIVSRTKGGIEVIEE